VAQRILLVDDDHGYRAVLKESLQEHYLVCEADSGQEVLSQVLALGPDLVVLDVDVSGKTGIEVCRELKHHPQTRTIPVLLLTDRSKQEDIVLGLQAGADDYLTKPMSPPEILARVEAHLASGNYYAGLEFDDLLMLLQLSETVSVCRNPLTILRLIVERMAAVTEVTRCSIVCIGAEGELVVKASSDLDGDREIVLEPQRYPEIGRALETRRAVVVNDIRNDPLMEPVRQYVEALAFNSIIVIPIVKKQSVIGTFFLRSATALHGGISERVFNLCHLVANISANALENASLFERMKSAQEYFEEMAIRDGLTRLYTHRHFYDRLEEEFSRTIRHRQPLSLLFFDIDDFKQINDGYGHTRGDVVLRRIGRTIREVVRESDIPARYGGEEFALLLPNTESGGAQEMARRLLGLIRQQVFEGLPEVTVTVSCGVATCRDGNYETFSQLVRRADAAMYRAKSAGKGQVCCAADAEPGFR